MSLTVQCLLEQCAIASPVTTYSLFLGWISVSGDIVFIAFLLWLLWRPSFDSLLLNAGYWFSLLLNFWLKETIAQDRPFPGTCGSDFGMPSGHTQHIAYAGVSLAILLGVRYQTFDCTTDCALNAWRISALSVVMALLLVFMGVSRVQLHYHSVEQVLVGYLVGILWASLWSYFWVWVTYSPQRVNTESVKRI